MMSRPCERPAILTSCSLPSVAAVHATNDKSDAFVASVSGERCLPNP